MRNYENIHSNRVKFTVPYKSLQLQIQTVPQHFINTSPSTVSDPQIFNS